MGRFQDFIAGRGLDVAVVEMLESTRSAEDAAATIGCGVEQIAKSLVFRGQTSGDPYLIIASGPNRVDEAMIAVMVGEGVALSDADFVRQATGYSIGGVPPFGHAHTLRTLIDEDLLSHAEIWAAAGTPRAVFRLSPADLADLSGGEVVVIH
jgi:prolyl-tRNA editing enzyme YbaK/EbsC (Cys-tRNA(Pro) deacylase)